MKSWTTLTLQYHHTTINTFIVISIVSSIIVVRFTRCHVILKVAQSLEASTRPTTDRCPYNFALLQSPNPSCLKSHMHKIRRQNILHFQIRVPMVYFSLLLTFNYHNSLHSTLILIIKTWTHVNSYLDRCSLAITILDWPYLRTHTGAYLRVCARLIAVSPMTTDLHKTAHTNAQMHTMCWRTDSCEVARSHQPQRNLLDFAKYTLYIVLSHLFEATDTGCFFSYVWRFPVVHPYAFICLCS